MHAVLLTEAGVGTKEPLRGRREDMSLRHCLCYPYGCSSKVSRFRRSVKSPSHYYASAEAGMQMIIDF